MVALLILSSTLMSCGGPRQPPRLATSPPAATETAATPQPPAAVTEAPAQISPAVLETPVPPPTVASLPPKPAVDQPNELIGLTVRLLSDRLGVPDFVQREGQVQIWRYAGSDCSLFVFLYPRQGDLRVDYVEVRAGGFDKAHPIPRPRTATDCYRDLRLSQPPFPG